MRVMKFISVAVGVAMLLTLAIAQQAATAPSTPTVKHVPIMRAPVNSGKICSTAIAPFATGQTQRAPAQRLRR